MKQSSFLLLFAVLMLSTFPCRGQVVTRYNALLGGECDTCANVTEISADPGHLICTGAAQMWERAFKNHYSYSAQPDTPFYFFMNPDTLQLLYQQGGPEILGVRVYFGLQHPVSSLSQVPSELCLMLVPFNWYGDVPPSDSSVIMLSDSTVTQRVPLSVARSYVNNWGSHYLQEPDYIVSVYAYNFSKTTLQQVVSVAKADTANKFYFLLGCHTVQTDDLGYCLPKGCMTCTTASLGVPHHSGQTSSPSFDSGSSVNTIYGYAAVSLVVAAQQGNSLQRSSDFARPCPRFCGRSLFYLSIKSEWKKP